MASSNWPGGGGGSSSAGWSKYTILYSTIKLLPGMDTGLINAFTLPSGYAVMSCFYNSTLWSAPSLGQCNLTVAADPAAPLYPGPFFQVSLPFISGGAFGYFTSPAGPASFAGATNITVEIILDQNLSTLTAGSVDVYIFTANMNGG